MFMSFRSCSSSSKRSSLNLPTLRPRTPSGQSPWILSDCLRITEAVTYPIGHRQHQCRKFLGEEFSRIHQAS